MKHVESAANSALLRCGVLAACALWLAVSPLQASAKEAAITVFAASSLTEALNEIGDMYAQAGHPRPVFSYAASSVLARQIDQGAKADVFFSADEPWMDYLAERQGIDPLTRFSLLSNKLVLAAPAGKPFTIDIKPGMDLVGALHGGKLSMADPSSVPAGKYGKAALQGLGAWNSVSGSVVRAENVRSALRFVETGDAAAGIVYATDVIASKKVVVAGVFPAGSHPRISYPVAVVKGSRAKEARAFVRFLTTRASRGVFEGHGFAVEKGTF